MIASPMWPDPLIGTVFQVIRVLTILVVVAAMTTPSPVTSSTNVLDSTPLEVRYAANRKAMHASGAPYRDQDGQFLLFDPHGDGLVAQVFGNLSTADRIAVLVPGVANRADNFWTGVGGQRDQAPSVQAAELYQAASNDRFAAIAWLGYDTPDDGLSFAAAREDLASAGAWALRQFTAGLAKIRPQATIALLGHSYGSTVIGLAAPNLPRQVTDIAVYGSPGMGVRDVTELRTTARVWAGQSARDWIRWVPGIQVFGIGHGTKPVDPDFGATVFSTSDVTGHGHYLAPGTDSLANLASIAVSGRLFR